MKIAYGSDIHIEFEYYDIENKENADVLVLAGDICVIEKFNYDSGKCFFDKCADEFEHVIYVPGNHEYYHGDLTYSFDKLKNLLAYRTNIHLMNNNFLDIGDVRFIGSTLWTNMNNYNPLTEQHVYFRMNDFRLITRDGGYFIPERVEEEYDESMKFIEDNLNEDKINVVVTHHAPSQQSISEEYADDYHMNGAYRTDLEEFISHHDCISAWIHGHTHHNVAYNISNTSVLSNQRGYAGIQEMAKHFELKHLVIDIDEDENRQ